MVILPIAVSTLLGVIFIHLTRGLCFRFGWVKQPRKDRWHNKPIPALGGLAIFLAFCATLGLFYPYETNLPLNYSSLLLGSAVALVLGLVDDLHPLTPLVKLVGQLFAATVIIFLGGNSIQFFPWPIANILLTYFWIIGITNAINLLDNMDGLAGGVALIASGILGYLFWKADNEFLLLLSLSLSGALVGFLIFNFPPARIFMGDSGSQFIGFLLASLAVARRSQASSVFAVLGVPTLLFLLPILDTTLVTVTRVLRGQSPAQGGTDHTSHRLITFGLSERQAIFVLFGVALIGGISGVALEALDYDTSLVLIPLIIMVLSLLTAYLGRIKIVSSIDTRSNSLARWALELAYRRRLLEILLDLVMVGTGYYLSYWTYSGLDMNQESMRLFLQSWPFAIGSAYFLFYLAGVYRGVWRYINIDDLLHFLIASIGSAALSYAILLLLYPYQGYRVGVFFLFSIFLLLGLAGTRLSFSVLDRLNNRQTIRSGGEKVILIGAGDAGEAALRWILRNPKLGYRPIGIVDDDPSLWGRSIFEVGILGGKNTLENILEEKKPDGVIFSPEKDDSQEELNNLSNICRERGIWLRVLRLEFELIENF
jgi:UDP-GlcNAc:undecaprenyl-phosphate/decaprenyl-phosphate GlcNAc-1-phosphate transferase